MDRLTLFDTMLRMLAIGQLLLIAVVIGRGRAPLAIRLITAVLLLGVASYLTIATPMFRPLDGPFWALVQLFAQSVPLMLWVFAHLLFERPVARSAAIAGLVALFGCWIGNYVAFVSGWQGGFVVEAVQRLTSLLLIGHAIAIAIGERGDDLIEKRRRLRVGFVVIVGALAFIVIVIEILLGFRRAGPEIAFGQALAILIATSAMGIALLESDPDLLFDPDRPAPAPNLSPAEQVLSGKVTAAMAGAVHREPGLTIGVLAERLGVPEHRLRSMINQRLGYRNFSAFLNHHRIADAKAWLADPAKVDLPVLTIAMDLGYGSLAPFNRAFREDTGQSPSEYRRAAFAEKQKMPIDSENDRSFPGARSRAAAGRIADGGTAMTNGAV
ncbi:helix-turn-helix domain-containing protein [Sphingomonas sp. AR_OL41]|uniref:AraC family transcriptional regulator n=1 Tax=Sphingomonas sp. AR_OL41 TaxID=3042729 RepID=UPI002480D623|nr:helix-turn-helix domain-containing protein [Sphingomonas sp. AR_OL41]MDH7975465.1 helix-turn-helix domain-containing protein [Sphingomonas sp. AR_OL41]